VSGACFYPTPLVPVAGDRFVFGCTDRDGDTELWRTDGTPGGTSRVADLWADGSSYPMDPGMYGAAGASALGGIAWMNATDGPAGTELWRTDGTAEGTWRVADLRPGPHGSTPNGFVTSAGHVFFTADDGVHGRELWVVSG
jgi:ELWxxDGT repeat protein